MLQEGGAFILLPLNIHITTVCDAYQIFLVLNTQVTDMYTGCR